jgi:hypothetical protein
MCMSHIVCFLLYVYFVLLQCMLFSVFISVFLYIFFVILLFLFFKSDINENKIYYI